MASSFAYKIIKTWVFRNRQITRWWWYVGEKCYQCCGILTRRTLRQYYATFSSFLSPLSFFFSHIALSLCLIEHQHIQRNKCKNLLGRGRHCGRQLNFFNHRFVWFTRGVKLWMKFTNVIFENGTFLPPHYANYFI